VWRCCDRYPAAFLVCETRRATLREKITWERTGREDLMTALVRCASSICESMRPLGIAVRSGLHTGEVEVEAR
jgi:hypothetical protein